MSEFTDTLKHARDLKASILQNIATLQDGPTSSSPQRSTPIPFEDTFIHTLRGEGKPWATITAQLNERRKSNNESPTWTEAAVYSRFVLNTAAPATPSKEVGFEPSDYAYLRNTGGGREGTSRAGKKRVKDFQNATELSANIRKPVKLITEGEVETPVAKAKSIKGTGKGKGKNKGSDEERRKGEETQVVEMSEGMAETLMRAVAKAERNFWFFVADEVEREGGRYIEPKELEAIFHSI